MRGTIPIRCLGLQVGRFASKMLVKEIPVRRPRTSAGILTSDMASQKLASHTPIMPPVSEVGGQTGILEYQSNYSVPVYLYTVRNEAGHSCLAIYLLLCYYLFIPHNQSRCFDDSSSGNPIICHTLAHTSPSPNRHGTTGTLVPTTRLRTGNSARLSANTSRHISYRTLKNGNLPATSPQRYSSDTPSSASSPPVYSPCQLNLWAL